MKLGDYFSNDFETNDSHYLTSLQTRYYRCRKEQAKEVIINLIKLENGKVLDDNETYNELLYETSNYSCVVTLSNPRSMAETAIDFKVTTNGLIPMGKGKKVIERLYQAIDQKLNFVTSGACKN